MRPAHTAPRHRRSRRRTPRVLRCCRRPSGHTSTTTNTRADATAPCAPRTSNTSSHLPTRCTRRGCVTARRFPRRCGCLRDCRRSTRCRSRRLLTPLSGSRASPEVISPRALRGRGLLERDGRLLERDERLLERDERLLERDERRVRGDLAKSDVQEARRRSPHSSRVALRQIAPHSSRVALRQIAPHPSLIALRQDAPPPSLIALRQVALSRISGAGDKVAECPIPPPRPPRAKTNSSANSESG